MDLLGATAAMGGSRGAHALVLADRSPPAGAAICHGASLPALGRLPTRGAPGPGIRHPRWMHLRRRLALPVECDCLVPTRRRSLRALHPPHGPTLPSVR